MPERSKLKVKPILLVKWRFAADKKGEAGEAKYWWSDGSKTQEKVASHVDAVRLLKNIQDNGGLQAAK
jgi:hypothetical protein